MKISDEAVEAACEVLSTGPDWCSDDEYCDRVRRAIQSALHVDGYPKLLAEALAVMRETGWPNAIDHATSVGWVIELAAYETYEDLCLRVYADGGVVSGTGGLMGGGLSHQLRKRLVACQDRRRL